MWYLYIYGITPEPMLKFFTSTLCLLSIIPVIGQSLQDPQPPTNARYDAQHLPWQVDLMWTPPPGWIHSAIDRWYEWDQGIASGYGIGSSYFWAEAAARWDAAQLNMYDEVYLTKIRYYLLEPGIDYTLLVFQGTPPGYLDTLLYHPLQLNLTYNTFDTMDLDPIPVDITKDLWIGYHVSSMAPGFPLPVGNWPEINGYGNMLRWEGNNWSTLTSVNPELRCNWSIGGYLETPNDTTIYPLFNIYRAVDEGSFELLNEEPYLDTIYYDNIYDLSASHIYYYITSVYEDGESDPSNIVEISFVGTEEISWQRARVYPNPAKEKVFIDSGNDRVKTIFIIDLQGKILLKTSSEDQKIELNTSRLKPSVYFIKVVTEGEVFTSKLMITE